MAFFVSHSPLTLQNIQRCWERIHLMLASFIPLAGTELSDSKGMLMAVVTTAGIVIVFAILVLLIVIFYAYGALFRALTARKERKAQQPEVSAPPASAPEATSAPEAAPVTDGIPGEIIAVIAAAVASLDGGYRIRKVSKAGRRQRTAGRTPWAASGLFENTRPF